MSGVDERVGGTDGWLPYGKEWHLWAQLHCSCAVAVRLSALRSLVLPFFTTCSPLCRPQAESRDHRRWIERYNNTLREKGKKEEFRRIRDFVECAERQDPR